MSVSRLDSLRKTNKTQFLVDWMKVVKEDNHEIQGQEKRREIGFTNRDSGEKILTEVVGLHRFKNFEAMFERTEPNKFGGESKEWLLNQISEFYPKEEQEHFGVIGIEILIKINS